MERIGDSIYNLCKSIFPICRSITGDGVRKTLKCLDDYISPIGYHLDVHEIPTGTKVFDWTIPKEWVIREAYIEDEKGNRIIDFSDNNLHVIGYCAPIDKWVDYDELNEYIYTQQDEPEWIPYVTSYYKERSGFCMSEKQRLSLVPGKYRLYCDSEFVNGSLTYADLIIPGRTEKEILISTYVCHPSMANDECSGPALVAELIKYVANIRERKYSYRFVFEPETIGAIAYISQNKEDLCDRVIAGFNLACVGDDKAYYLVETPLGDSLADRVANAAMRYREGFRKFSFLERGSDERHYNSPGIDIPMVCLGRSKYAEFPEYHTSADDMAFVTPQGFLGSYEVMTDIIEAIEKNAVYKAVIDCEPQLGKRGLYPTVSQKGIYDEVQVLLDVFAYSNGKRDVIDISNSIKKPISAVLNAIRVLAENDLIRAVSNV